METLQVGESGFCSQWKQGEQGEEELDVCLLLISSPSRVPNITVLRVINGPANVTLTKFTVQ